VDGFVRIGAEKDFSSRTPTAVTLDGLDIVLIRVDNKWTAFENNCPHQHFAVLHQGALDKAAITCPMHGWMFDLKTGESLTGNGRLRMFEIRKEDDELWMKRSEGNQHYSLFDK
jgi:nitrite reductase/ring-hydroxylating ferredoxin subunit